MKKMKASKWCGSQQHTHYNSVVGWRGCGMQHKDEAHRNLRCYKHSLSDSTAAVCLLGASQIGLNVFTQIRRAVIGFVSDT